MPATKPATHVTEDDYPGQDLGLPRSGPGSLAGWFPRITAIVIDWAFSMLLSALVLGLDSLTTYDWRRWGTLAIFFLQRFALTMITGASVGQLLCRITVARLDRQKMGLLRSLGRAALLSIAIPALVIGANRRGLHDLACGTVVLSRR
ncbi:RDD family protein [Propionibacteriaceae bacterium Y2011]|uniref:RDD family protein n=1 Tax=Microlunatus sp. Y2014 TaxID=3418488 RepID=UPI003B4A4C08